MISLKSAEDTRRFTTQKVMWMETGQLMHRWNPNIYLLKKYRLLKVTFYKDPLYGTLPSLLGNKLAQVLISRDFIFVAPMKSKADVVIGLIDLYENYGIP